jgi:tetratricopeptide (TPR) repeat protein
LSKYPEAILAFENAIHYDKNEQNLFNSLKMKAYCYFRSEKYKDAITDFTKAIEKDENSCDEAFYRDLAIANLYNNQTTNALDALNKSIKLKAIDTDTQYTLACYYVQNNEISEAMKIFEKLLQGKTINSQFIRKDKLLSAINKEFKDNKELKELIKKYAK